ncbi:Long-chain-fatty-acid--CoA ligase [Chondromyces apiculatus DSM 436]|uniref:Long-chain-fatty-acid--CoA ligase n=2 Tax=Chondromyces apiculatus TaxID=51 RepID=A0A017SU39_9BACT|nr:Long-chain-fatty-acid--CoA ligase [Chondromyces apiculatus DSM 436]
MVLASPVPLGDYARCVGDWLEHWASAAPERVFLTERAPDGALVAVTFGEARERVRALAQALLDLGLSPERPLALLSDNDVHHALLQLAAMHVGIPAVPVSPAYALMSRDLEKLRHILGVVRPGAVFAADGAAFARALGAAGEVSSAGRAARAPRLLTSRNAPPGALSVDALGAGPHGEAVERAFRAITPDTVAKILFTSGSTGAPKGVLNTQRMLCSNQAMIAALWPFLRARPPVTVDWLPWSHTFGGNHNFNMFLCHGGTLHVDSGKPAPGLVERTVARLREASSTLYFNVPRGYEMLLPYLEADAALREVFFRDLDALFYAAAALPQSLWERLEAVSRRARGEAVPLISAWGATETSPMATCVHFPLERAGNIGLPPPGCEIRLAPVGDRLEIRVRGPQVTPGYLDGGREDAFDAQGFYRTGDAAKLADPQAPELGILFDGRISENFKLSSGTWVAVGELRVALVAAASPAVQDAVITGHDREEVGALLFLSAAGCARLASEGRGREVRGMPMGELLRDEGVRAHVRAALQAHNQGCGGSSRRVGRVLFLEEPPSIDGGEITDKGYLNQRAVLTRRAALVERLHAAEPAEDVLVIST